MEMEAHLLAPLELLKRCTYLKTNLFSGISTVPIVNMIPVMISPMLNILRCGRSKVFVEVYCVHLFVMLSIFVLHFFLKNVLGNTLSPFDSSCGVSFLPKHLYHTY